MIFSVTHDQLDELEGGGALDRLESLDPFGAVPYKCRRRAAGLVIPPWAGSAAWPRATDFGMREHVICCYLRSLDRRTRAT